MPNVIIPPEGGSHVEENETRIELLETWSDALDVYLVDKFFGEFNVLDYDASGDGITDDVAEIEDAVVAASEVASNDTRSVVTLAPGREFRVGKRIPSSANNGGIMLEQGVSLDGRGATIILNANANIVTNHWPYNEEDNEALPDLKATITSDVAVGDVQFTVDSTTGFAAGGAVIVRLNDNVTDPAEVKDWFHAIVLSVDDATHLTLDRPSPVICDVSEQEAINKAIFKTFRTFDGGFIRDLTLIDPRTGSSNTESAIDLRYVRNMVVENIVADHPGAGAVLLAYPESVTLRNIRVRQSEMQSGQTSKGRALNIWNAKNVRVENFYAERFEGCPVFIESYSKNVSIDGMHLVNNHPDRVHASYPFFQIAQGSNVHIKDLIVDGEGGSALVDLGATTGNDIDFENLWINTTTQLLEVPLTNISGTLRIGDTLYTELVRRTVPFKVTPSIGSEYFIPAGLYRRVRIFITDKTGLTELYVLSVGGGALTTAATLTNNTLVDIPGAGFYGDNYPFNDSATKKIAIYADGTVPAGVYGFLEIEYWPTTTNDVSKGRQELQLVNPPAYTATNVTTDRSFDANSTTTDELADVLGTLIGDLRQSGWIA